MNAVLLVDDDASNLESLQRVFVREGFVVRTARDGREALDVLRREACGVVLTDLMMPGVDGMDLLKAIKAVAPETEVVLMTAYGSVETAVAAMKEGATDFIPKPLRRADVVRAVRRAADRAGLVAENRALRAELQRMGTPRDILGQSPAIRHALALLEQVAPSTAGVLIEGESGTGKELFARALHRLSPRAAGPFVPVHCAAIPETLMEAELFGHEKGAFTGAIGKREGRFGLADGGTLLLDEVGEIPPGVQVKLLRVLQEGTFERLGSSTPVRTDVRVVATTNRDLRAEVKAGRFREDLFFRLDVVTLRLPSLRERQGDVPLIAQAMLARFAAREARAVRGFTDEALALVEAHSWPGNVRELEHAVERAVLLCRGEWITPGDLPPSVVPTPSATDAPARSLQIPIGTPLEEVERRVIAETLHFTHGDKRAAAALLGIATRTIYRKLGSGSDAEAPPDTSAE